MSPRSPSHAVTLRGLAVVFWALLGSLLCSVLVEQRGLRWIQGVVWPSDLYAFQQVEQGPLDVAILGSSRSAFGLSPSSLDRCLTQKLGRPTHSVNLSRAFTTSYTADLLAEDLLAGPRIPKVLVLAVEAELFDEHNHRLDVSVGRVAGLADIPGAVGTVDDLAGLFALLRPIARGPETLALYLSGRWDTKPWLRWLMLHHGGGMFCTGSDHCRQHNKAVEATLDGWWDIVVRALFPNLGGLRFPDYTVGDGPVHRHTEALLARAEQQGVRVVLAELPRHPEFDRRIPAEVEPAYRGYLSDLVEQHALPHHTAAADRWATQRSYYLDPEHLTAAGAHRASKDLCERTLAPLMLESDAREGGR